MDKRDVCSATSSTRWPEWAVRALCALARRILHERNETCGKNWPAGQDWHELGHTSQHSFMRAAREECGISHDAYRDAVQAVCDSAEFDLDVVWADMDRRSEIAPSKPERVDTAEFVMRLQEPRLGVHEDGTEELKTWEQLFEQCQEAARLLAIPSATRRMSELVPTNWLDPLLTGPAKVLGAGHAYTGKDIENLLQAVKQRIERAEAGDVK